MAPARRRRPLGLSFVAAVLLPMTLLGAYLYGFASDRFVSFAGLSVRSEDPLPGAGAISGLSAFTGSAKPDSAILHSFLTSSDLVQRLDRRIGLRERLKPPKFDPLIGPNPTTFENLHRRWSRLVVATHDSRSGIVTLRVSAFTSEDAHVIATAAIEECADMLARLSDQMRRDSLDLARTELARAESQLRDARYALAAFRSSTRGADPTAEFETLQIEVEYARARYVQSRAALDAALVQAQKTGRYLAVHIEPVRAEAATLPRKGQTLWISGLGLMLIWMIGVMGVKGMRAA